MFSLSTLHLSFILVGLLPFVSAQHPNQSSGYGRGSSDISFNQDILAQSIDSITDSFRHGPNRTKQDSLPVKKVYGVNLGNWLLFEPWMSNDEWISMGGEKCDDCSTCRRSEWSLVKHLGQRKADKVFRKHWRTWFTKRDAAEIRSFGINVVRIPLGFWLIEDLVNRKTEHYARGGLHELIRGLRALKANGIHVILDHHALPGVSSKNQMFAGNCTSDIKFYSDYNYQRAATWTAVMTFLSHTHPAFEKVFAIQAVNEPEMNVELTPGYDRFQKSFVLTMRAMEYALGIVCDSRVSHEAFFDNITRKALAEAFPIIFRLARKYDLDMGVLQSSSFVTANTEPTFGELSRMNRHKRCLSSNFMNRDWQWSNNPAKPVPNPADVARGPQVYDNHLYFNFGGVANHTMLDYMTVLCNMHRTEDAEKIGNTPMYFGEWSLATNFPNGTTDAFQRNWGDAQKLIYGKSSGWIFWSWKVVSPDAKYMWSYRDAVFKGLMPKKASALFNHTVCDAFKAT